jgi:tetratricopeptide (TPR) repeat protein
VTSVAETITVTAEAPRLLTVASVASNIGGSDFADRLMSALSPGAPLFDENELTAKPLAERLAMVDDALARLSTLSTLDDRFRYYLAARAVLGGTKLFQAQAALAVRADAPELAVRWLTDLADAYPDDAPLLRLIGRVLDGWGRADLARLLFERALELAPRETQTWRELLLIVAREGRDGELAELRKRYASYDRDDRMKQTDDALAAELGRARSGIDPRRDDAAELQVELMWDANYTDVDLHVGEPGGEEVFYRHMTSQSGGRLSTDVTSGFGPETYTTPRLASGPYEISLTYYGGDTTRQTMATFAHVIVYVRGDRQDYFIPLIAAKEKRVVATVGK